MKIEVDVEPPPTTIGDDGDDDGPPSCAVFVSVYTLDGTGYSASAFLPPTIDPEGNPGKFAAAIIQTALGVARATGEHLHDQLTMRITDPDRPTDQRPQMGVTVTMLDQWRAEYVATNGHDTNLKIRVTGGRAIPFADARALLVMAGAL